STFGRRVFLVGGNPVMTRLVGIHVDRVMIACYVLSGLLAATAGLILSGFVGLVDNFVGRGFELDSIVVAVLGGVALSGGRGTIIGVLAGAAILVVITNAVLLFGLPFQFQLIIKGIVIVIAAVVNAPMTGDARSSGGGMHRSPRAFPPVPACGKSVGRPADFLLNRITRLIGSQDYRFSRKGTARDQRQGR